MSDPTIGHATLSGKDAEDFIRLLGKKNSKSEDDIPRGVQVLRLQEAYRQSLETHSFALGDLVQVKPALYGNFNYPKPGQPALIIKTYDPPLMSAGTDSGDADFGRKFDVSLRVCLGDERIAEFPYSSELLEPYRGEDQ
jgi:hypothetical protein